MSTVTVSDPVAVYERARQELRRARRAKEILFLVIFAAVFAFSVVVGEVSLKTLIEGLPGLFNYISDTIPAIPSDNIVGGIREWFWAFPKWLALLWDTIIIAFLGTLLGTVGALFFCFAGSRNLMSSPTVYFVTRRLTEIARAVPELVYAMIFVFAFGLGPLPGVLAIMVHSAGALGKLFSEVNENIDMGPVEGVRAAGGNWFQIIRLAVLPQVLPNYLSYALLRFEINVRSAAVIGFVGAGGIGQELMFVIRQFVYTDVSAIVLMIIATVALIDMSCEKLRHQFIDEQKAKP
ncbi:MAG: phosphonate ABC transporter, permease protein PhnE [Pseudomonadota bacterium]